MIELTLKFTSIDEAIVALGKLTAGAPRAAKGVPVHETAPAAAAAPATKRRGRPRKTTGAPTAPEAEMNKAGVSAPESPAQSVAPSTETAAPEKAPADADNAQPSGTMPAPATTVDRKSVV